MDRLNESSGEGESEMKSYKRTNSIWNRNQISRPDKGISAFDDLKNMVRDRLLALTAVEREAFILALETEMRRVHLSMRAYLIPLGISARRPDELTPIETAHLVRFLKINVPQAMPAIENAMARFSVFAEKQSDWLAA
jgi:hypothetical protein